MLKYILKRLLLMIPTFIGGTFLVYCIISMIPNGPIDRAITQLQMGGATAGEGVMSGGGSGQEAKIDERVLEMLRKQYGLDQPFFIRYLVWLGVYPRETQSKKIAFGKPFRENVKLIENENNEKFYIQRWIRVDKEGDQIKIFKSGKGADYAFDNVPELPNHTEITDWFPSNDWDIGEEKDGQISLSQSAFSGIFTGDLGVSHVHNRSVWKLIRERMHVSLYFGIIGFLLSYLVCIPLGISKAIRHNTTYDFLTSTLIFMGYAVPAYALGVLLLKLLGGGGFLGVEIFPLGGFRSENFDELSFLGKVWDQIHHTILPVICYMVGSFAVLTLLMKNSLMENLSQDYVRTAFAKGLPEKTIIFKHAVRNSLIPIATGLGGIVGIFLSGSYLIEFVFNIDGIGLLGFEAIKNMDYPIFMGFTVLSILALLIGNLISDILYVVLDPRIQFT